MYSPASQGGWHPHEVVSESTAKSPGSVVYIRGSADDPAADSPHGTTGGGNDSGGK